MPCQTYNLSKTWSAVLEGEQPDSRKRLRNISGYKVHHHMTSGDASEEDRRCSQNCQSKIKPVCLIKRKKKKCSGLGCLKQWLLATTHMVVTQSENWLSPLCRGMPTKLINIKADTFQMRAHHAADI